MIFFVLADILLRCGQPVQRQPTSGWDTVFGSWSWIGLVAAVAQKSRTSAASNVEHRLQNCGFLEDGSFQSNASDGRRMSLQESPVKCWVTSMTFWKGKKKKQQKKTNGKIKKKKNIMEPIIFWIW